MTQMEKNRMKIIFMGTPEFAVASLRRLIQNKWNVVAIVTAPDKPAGRGHKMLQSDVKKYALEEGLPVLQPRNLKAPEFIAELKSYEADLFVVIAFRMLPKEVWSMPRLGCFNLHASLLPKYRGAAPMFRAVMNGEAVTGVTTFFLNETIDTGDIIDQTMIAIHPDETVESVHDRLMEIGAEMTLRTVQEICDGNLTVTSQPEGEFIPAPKIFRTDCEIHWEKDAVEVHNHIRGLSPYPGARTTIVDDSGRKMEAKILRSALTRISRPEKFLPGQILPDKKQLLVACGNEFLEILSLQPAGKKPMDAGAFLLGYHPIECRQTALDDDHK